MCVDYSFLVWNARSVIKLPVDNSVDKLWIVCRSMILGSGFLFKKGKGVWGKTASINIMSAIFTLDAP